MKIVLQDHLERAFQTLKGRTEKVPMAFTYTAEAVQFGGMVSGFGESGRPKSTREGHPEQTTSLFFRLQRRAPFAEDNPVYAGSM